MKAVLLRRAMQWFNDEVTVSAIQARLKGLDEPTTFHTVAFLFLQEDACPIVRAQKAPDDWVLDGPAIQERIKDLQVRPQKLAAQRAIVSEFVPSQATPEMLLRIAAANASHEHRLPVAYLAFGRNDNDNSEVILLQACMGAPLDLVLEEFKRRIT